MNKNFKIPHVFDVNGTLIRQDAESSKRVQNFLVFLKDVGHTIWITSGDDVAEMKINIEKLGLTKYISNFIYKPDLVDAVMRQGLDVFLYDDDPTLGIIFKKFIQC
jgi:hypothetical protein